MTLNESLLIVTNETRKALSIFWSYRFNVISWVLLTAFGFIGLLFVIGNGQVDRRLVATALPGYVIWFFCTELLSGVGAQMRDEASSGTLEQLYMSPAPASLMLIGRILSTLLTATFQAIVLMLTVVVFMSVAIPLPLALIPIVLITLLELGAVGFLIAGLGLVFKRVEELGNLLQTGLIFVNGAIVPFERLPIWLASIGRLMPGAPSIDLIRRMMFSGQTLAGAWRDGTLMALIIHVAAYMVVGGVVYAVCQRIAMRNGTLAQY